MEKLVIEEKRSKAMLIALAGLCMLIVSVALWIFGMKEKRVFFWITGFIMTVIFGINFLVLLMRSLERKALLTITFDGIIDSLSAGSVRYIAFQDIEQFCIVSQSGKKVIGVIPKEEETFNNKLSPVNQGEANSNKSLKCPTLSLRVDRAKDMSLEDIFTLLKKRLDDYSCLYD